MTKVYITLGVIVLIVGLFIAQLLRINTLETELDNANEAIIYYEALTHILPFESVAKERKDRANEDINTTLSSDIVIPDDVYSL